MIPCLIRRRRSSSWLGKGCNCLFFVAFASPPHADTVVAGPDKEVALTHPEITLYAAHLIYANRGFTHRIRVTSVKNRRKSQDTDLCGIGRTYF